MYYLGVDPGVANIGMAITDKEGQLIESCVYNFKNLAQMDSVVETITGLVEAYEICITSIERFVAYKGQYTSSSEEILMFIGALTFSVRKNCDVVLYRAIEWKPKLCKYLVKTKEFDNPSTSFDKKYSRAAATCITGLKLKTDHEADAACLSYMWKVNDKI